MSPEFLPWVVLFAVVGSMLVLDLFVLHREAKTVPFREAAGWSLVWISLSMAYGLFITLIRGGDAGAEYLAGYIIELSLSVDNVFVFALIFTAFAVPAAYQHRLLFWGILGAVVFRGVFIAAGTAVLAAAHWVLYLLGILLVVTGIRLARSRGHAVQPEKNPVLRLFRRLVPMTADYRGASFFVRENGRRIATPLLAVLVAIETTDIMFALDSIPAVFAITTDPLIVFASNLFAILGLRALYFLLAGLLDRFVYLKLGLAALLVFAGAKILVGSVYNVTIAQSLTIIVVILGISIAASFIATHPRRGDLRLPGLRIVAVPVLALVAAGYFVLIAAIRDSAAWPEWLAAGAIVGSAAAASAGIVGLRQGHSPLLSAAAVRIGTGVLLGAAMIAVFYSIAVARDAGTWWVLLDLAIVAGAAAAMGLGYLWLRHVRAPSILVRAWATGAAAILMLIGVFVAFD